MVVIYETNLHSRYGQCVNDCHHVPKAEKQLAVQSKQQDMHDIYLLLKAWRLSRDGCPLCQCLMSVENDSSEEHTQKEPSSEPQFM